MESTKVNPGITISKEAVIAHITKGKKSKSTGNFKFFFKAFNNGEKSKWDIDYIPEKGHYRYEDEEIPVGVIQTMVDLLSKDLLKFAQPYSLNDLNHLRFLDNLTTICKKRYQCYDEKDQMLGTVETCAPWNKLEDILLLHYPQATSFIECQ